MPGWLEHDHSKVTKATGFVMGLLLTQPPNGTAAMVWQAWQAATGVHAERWDCAMPRTHQTQRHHQPIWLRGSTKPGASQQGVERGSLCV